MKKLWFLMAAALSVCMLSFSAGAAAEAYTVNGEKTVFLSNDSSVTYQGTTYTPFSSLAQALSALGSDGGKAIVCGSFTPDDNVNDSDFVDPAGRGTVTVTGATGAGTDSLNQSATLNFKSGKIIFDDVTLNMVKTKYFAAPDLVTTNRFKVSSNGSAVLFFTGLLSGNANKITQEISGGTFSQINLVGMSAATLGSESSPGYASVTIHDGKINANLNGGSGYSQAKVYGNLYFVVNGGSFSKKAAVYNKLQHISGRKVVIFNNGMADGFTVPEDVCVIQSASGGMVTVDEATAADPNPVLNFQPEGDLTPFINGAILMPGEDGRYTMTVTENGVYTVEWQTSCTVQFHVNGGIGETPSPITGISGSLFDLPISPKLEKENCLFIGWNTNPDATTGFYSLKPQGDTLLYAIWLEKLPFFPTHRIWMPTA